ncbi:MAG TPA: histidine phosphatase family protein [Stellaceae bacterium]|nr:histidine phosphatase family protein [Stellaceae bacterium]
MRHAAAAGKGAGGSDRERPLTPDGRRAAELLGRRLKSEGMSPDHVLCSPARRARETLDGLAIALGALPPADFDDALYLADCHSVLHHLRAVPAETKCLLLIGHNPGLEELVRGLAGAASAAVEAGLPAAGLAIFQVSAAWSALSPASARLTALFTS